MAQRTFLKDDSYTLLRGVTSLFPVVNVGGAGAVTLQKRTFAAAGAGSATPKYSLVAAPTSGTGYAQSDGFGIKSVVRNSAGNWTIVLSDNYLYLIQCSCVFANSGATFNAPLMVVDSNTSNTNVTNGAGNGTGGKITVQFYNGSGVATDPGSGDQAQFCIILGKNAS